LSPQISKYNSIQRYGIHRTEQESGANYQVPVTVETVESTCYLYYLVLEYQVLLATVVGTTRYYIRF